jgi:hypothetical protein
MLYRHGKQATILQNILIKKYHHVKTTDNKLLRLLYKEKKIFQRQRVRLN